MEGSKQKEDIVKFFLENGVLVNKEVLEKMDLDEAMALKMKLEKKDIISLNTEISELIKKEEHHSMDWKNVEKIRANLEKREDVGGFKNIVESLKKDDKETVIEKKDTSINVMISYESEPKKIEVQDFILHYHRRYEAIKNILMGRQELQNITSINKLFMKKEREAVSIIGVVQNKILTKNGNWMIYIEDMTGTIKIVVNKNRPEIFTIASNTSYDEVVGVVGVLSKDIIFANNLIYPDVPLTKEYKKGPDECYALFMGDTHFGLNVFLHERLERFIKWINGETGNEKQIDMARKVKYLFVVGDLVEGVGIYPGQENDLSINDIYEQYQAFADFIAKIPNHIEIIVCPGNHDAMRIAEPQPPLYKDFAKPIYDNPKVTVVSNPSYINIHKKGNFPGFDVLLYHGYSFPYYGDNLEFIRMQGGLERPDLIMRYLLQRRHLAPAHKSTLYIPSTKKDPLVIEKVPDFFISGHIHRTTISNYRNVTTINCSTWVGETDYQEKVGLKPQPARVPIVNLQTREAKILKF